MSLVYLQPGQPIPPADGGDELLVFDGTATLTVPINAQRGRLQILSAASPLTDDKQAASVRFYDGPVTVEGIVLGLLDVIEFNDRMQLKHAKITAKEAIEITAYVQYFE